MILNISSAEQDEEALRLSKFKPDGDRSVCPFVRANGYGKGVPAEYYADSNRDVSVVLPVEGKGGIEACDDIIELPGVDCLFAGPRDMAVSLGHPGEEGHPDVHNAIVSMIRKARRIDDKSHGPRRKPTYSGVGRLSLSFPDWLKIRRGNHSGVKKQPDRAVSLLRAARSLHPSP